MPGGNFSFIVKRRQRQGTTIVELAFVLPIFLLVLFAIFEFGHAYLTIDILKAAARESARYGVSDGRSSADVIAKANEMLSASMDISNVTIYVKDAGLFDEAGGGTFPENMDDLTDIEVSDMESRRLFIVRIEIPYGSVSVMPNGWLKDVTLSGQAVMRHE